MNPNLENYISSFWIDVSLMLNPFLDHATPLFKSTQGKYQSPHKIWPLKASPISLTWLPLPFLPQPTSRIPPHIGLLLVPQHINYTTISRLLLLSLPCLELSCSAPHICIAHSLTFFRPLLTMRPCLANLYNIEPTCPNPHPSPVLLIPLLFNIFFYSNYHQTNYIFTCLFVHSLNNHPYTLPHNTM